MTSPPEQPHPAQGLGEGYRRNPPPVDHHYRNGFGIAALVIALVGALFGLIPITGWIAIICGVVALVFGLIGYSRKRKRIASNGKTAIAGSLLAVLSIALGIVGTVILTKAVKDIDTALKGGNSAPAAQLQFGQEYTKDGITYTVGLPEVFTPGKAAMTTTKLPRAVKMTFKLTNNTDKPLPAMGINIQGTGAGQQLEKIFDSEQNVGNSPTADVLPGQSIGYTVGFGVPAEPTELTVQVSATLSFSSDTKAYYVGKV
jgi:hypothetical protein